MEDLSHYNPEGSDLRKAQMRMVEILDVFDQICRRHGINYWLDWGTLLGARRHSGFIPWDDDIDVCILQSDYKKLIDVLKKELPTDLVLQITETDKKYPYMHPKIRDTKSLAHSKSVYKYGYNGLFLDIFLIEPVPSLAIKSYFDKVLRSNYRFKRSKKLTHKINNGLMICARPFMYPLMFLFRSYYKYIGHGKLYARSYGGGNYTRYNINDILPVREIAFEGRKYLGPHDVDKYLVNQFGSTYMKIPEPSQRIYHTNKFEFFY